MRSADLIIEFGKLRGSAPRPLLSAAIVDGRIAALASAAESPDLMEAWRGTNTRFAYAPGIYGYPGWVDTHAQLARAAQDCTASSDHGARLNALEEETARAARLGVTSVRDPVVTPTQWCQYAELARTGRLQTRVHPLIATTPASVAQAGSFDSYLDSLEAAGMMPRKGAGRLRLWGLQIVLDDGAGLPEKRRGPHEPSGDLMWHYDDLAGALTTATRRRWPIGVRAFSAAGIATLMEAIALVTRRGGAVDGGRVVVDRGAQMTLRQIKQLKQFGLHVTTQYALLDHIAPALIGAVGREETAAIFPLRGLVNAGAAVSAGTDYPAAALDPLPNVLGMETRKTKAGLIGVGHALTRYEAWKTYTTGGHQLLHPAGPPPLALGAPADFVGYPADILRAPAEELEGIKPDLVVVDGSIMHADESITIE